MLIKWILLSIIILFALAADRAWNQGYKFSAALAGFFFIMNFILWVYILCRDFGVDLQIF